jgi:hypothetical protein
MTIKYDKDTGLYVLTKQPGENILFDMPLAKIMRTGDTISGYVATFPTYTNMGKVASSTNITIVSSTYSGTTAQIRISAGQANENYKITVRVTTTLGDTIEADGMLYVRDR